MFCIENWDTIGNTKTMKLSGIAVAPVLVDHMLELCLCT